MNLNLSKLHLAVALALPLYAHAANTVVVDSDLLARGNAGDAIAQRQIGEQLLHGDGTPQNIPDAFRWLLMASEQGDSTADAVLADFYLSNRVDGASYKMAIQHLKRAAFAGNLRGADNFAQALVEHALRQTTPKEQADEEFAAAMPFLRTSANRKNITSCWYLGYLSFIGKGVKHNASDATRYMRCAADGGHALASFWVAGEILAASPAPLESGSPRVEEARKYLHVASDRGHRGASDLLATLPPEAKAVEPLKQIVAKTPTRKEPLVVELIKPDPVRIDAPKAQTVVTVDTRERLPAPTMAAPATAISAPETVIDKPAPVAVTRSADELQAELDAANQRIRAMQEQLAIIRATQNEELQGESLNRQALTAIKQGDYVTAIAKLRSAVAVGDIPATANLGLMYLQGSGVEHNAGLAIDLLTRAAERGNRTAAENLGHIYESGISTPRDVKLAIAWYRRAQSLGSIRALPALKRIGAES